MASVRSGDNRGSKDARESPQERRARDYELLVRGPDPVQRVFTITRLEDRIEMVDDEAAI